MITKRETVAIVVVHITVIAVWPCGNISVSDQPWRLICVSFILCPRSHSQKTARETTMLLRRNLARVPQNKVTLQVEALEDRLLATVTPAIDPHFTSFNVVDAAGDQTTGKVFRGGALKVNYDLIGTTPLNKVSLEAWQDGSK